MNHKNRIAGRFLPSRIFARWVWTVRCALLVLPAILFLAGGLTLFLAPNQYQSKAVFKYLGERSLDEVVGILKSDRLVNKVVKAIELNRRFEVDLDTAISLTSDATELKVDRLSKLIEIKVTYTDREDARDIAFETVRALQAHESQLMIQTLTTQIEETENFATQARDEAEFKKLALARLIQVRTEVLSDPLGKLDIDAARSAWENSLNRTFDLENKIALLKRELASPRNWVESYINPDIAHTPIGKKADASLGTLIIRVLLIGLASALTLPYLLELLFPRRLRAKKSVSDVKFEDPDLMDSAVNG